MDLDERKAAILKAVVEEHIHTAQPVGSQTIARSGGLQVSSATVRNEMTILEREGYLVQPHTSAGRIPTDLGYRFFVDHLTQQSALAPAQRRAVSDFFAVFTSAHQVLEDLLNETSQLLARVSTHTAVVVGPQPDTATVRSVQLVSLQPGLLLVLAILSNGSVEKCVLHLVDEITDDDHQPRRRRARRAARRVPVGRAPGDPGSRRHRTGEQPRSRGPRCVGVAGRVRERGAAVRRWCEPPRRRAGGVPEAHERRAAARAPRAPGRGRLTGARPARSGRNRLDRVREPDATSCATARSSSRPTRSRVRSSAPSACSGPPGWTTARRSRPSKPSPTSWAGSSRDRLLRSPRRSHARRPTTRSSARTERRRGATTPTTTAVIRRPRRSSRKSASPTRRCAIPSAGGATTSSAKTARARRAPSSPATSSGSATSSTPSSVATRTAFGRQAGPPRAPDAEAVVNLDLPQAAFGTTASVEVRLPVSCSRCEGTGCEPGTHPARCDVCGGTGEVREVRRSILGQIMTASPCVACSATGSRIPTRRVATAAATGVCARRAPSTSKCPPVSTTASASALPAAAPPRRAAASPATSTSPCASRPTSASSATARISCTPRRIAFTQAALGARLEVQTLEGPEELIVTPGTQPGHVFKLKGRGVPALRGRGRGDLLVRVDVEVPGRLSSEEDELLRSLASTPRRRGRRARQGRVLAAQVRVPVRLRS